MTFSLSNTECARLTQGDKKKERKSPQMSSMKIENWVSQYKLYPSFASLKYVVDWNKQQ